MSYINFFVAYILLINLLTGILFLVDKRRSSRFGSRRISEKTLLTCALIGGSPAALVAMYLARHKTKKLSFQAVLAIIITLQIFVALYLLQLTQQK